LREKEIIFVSKETKRKLKSFGRMDETFEDLISKMVEHISSCDSWWAKRH